MRYRGLRCWFKVKRDKRNVYYYIISIWLCLFVSLLYVHIVVNSYGHIWTVSYPDHTIPRQACLGQITST